MNSDNTQYNPAEDENQGVMTKLAQGEEANTGIPQAAYMSPVTASGPEPEKAEIADSEATIGLNDDMLEEEDIEQGNVDVEYEDGDN